MFVFLFTKLFKQERCKYGQSLGVDARRSIFAFERKDVLFTTAKTSANKLTVFSASFNAINFGGGEGGEDTKAQKHHLSNKKRVFNKLFPGLQKSSLKE